MASTTRRTRKPGSKARQAAEAEGQGASKAQGEGAEACHWCEEPAVLHGLCSEHLVAAAGQVAHEEADADEAKPARKRTTKASTKARRPKAEPEEDLEAIRAYLVDEYLPRLANEVNLAWAGRVVERYMSEREKGTSHEGAIVAVNKMRPKEIDSERAAKIVRRVDMYARAKGRPTK